MHKQAEVRVEKDIIEKPKGKRRKCNPRLEEHTVKHRQKKDRDGGR